MAEGFDFPSEDDLDISSMDAILFSEYSSVELKFLCNDFEPIREYLRFMGAQNVIFGNFIDTYYLPDGNLRLRKVDDTEPLQLISYDKEQKYGSERTCKTLVYPEGFPTIDWMEEMVRRSHGILAIVEQERNTWELNNVGIHLDTIPQLGNFVEVQALKDPSSNERTPLKQCEIYLEKLKVSLDEVIIHNYGELMAMKNKS
jgi:adenylate cyclase class IV